MKKTLKILSLSLVILAVGYYSALFYVTRQAFTGQVEYFLNDNEIMKVNNLSFSSGPFRHEATIEGVNINFEDILALASKPAQKTTLSINIFTGDLTLKMPTNIMFKSKNTGKNYITNTGEASIETKIENFWNLNKWRKPGKFLGDLKPFKINLTDTFLKHENSTYPKHYKYYSSILTWSDFKEIDISEFTFEFNINPASFPTDFRFNSEYEFYFTNKEPETFLGSTNLSVNLKKITHDCTDNIIDFKSNYYLKDEPDKFNKANIHFENSFDDPSTYNLYLKVNFENNINLDLTTKELLSKEKFAEMKKDIGASPIHFIDNTLLKPLDNISFSGVVSGKKTYKSKRPQIFELNFDDVNLKTPNNSFSFNAKKTSSVAHNYSAGLSVKNIDALYSHFYDGLLDSFVKTNEFHEAQKLLKNNNFKNDLLTNIKSANNSKNSNDAKYFTTDIIFNDSKGELNINDQPAIQLYGKIINLIYHYHTLENK